jgi:hypothetical protein
VGAGGAPPPDAKPLFEGPIETQKQQDDVPAEFKPKLAKALAALPKPGVPAAVDVVAPAPAAVPAPPRAANRTIAPRRIAVAGGPGGGGGIVFADPTAAAARGARVVTSTDKDNLMIARIDGAKVSYILVFSQADGKTLYDGPVKTDEQRKALPEAVAKQLDVLEKNQRIAPEFGVVGRN